MNEQSPAGVHDILDWLQEQGKRRAETVPEFAVEKTLSRVRAARAADARALAGNSEAAVRSGSQGRTAQAHSRVGGSTSRAGRTQTAPLPDDPVAMVSAELRRLRDQAGLTYRDLADLAGYSLATVTAACSGRRLPSWRVTWDRFKAPQETDTPFFPRGVFISYRRSDTGPYARLLKEHLSSRFPGTPIFMDLDSIEAGLDFAEVIRGAVNSSLVMVALIGSRWATAVDEEGRRRIDDPADYVRFEIRTALEHGMRVIPALADGAKPPRAQQLPPDLRKLARLNALEMSYDRLEYDESRLAAVIEKVLAANNHTPVP